MTQDRPAALVRLPAQSAGGDGDGGDDQRARTRRQEEMFGIHFWESVRRLSRFCFSSCCCFLVNLSLLVEHRFVQTLFMKWVLVSGIRIGWPSALISESSIC